MCNLRTGQILSRQHCLCELHTGNLHNKFHVPTLSRWPLHPWPWSLPVRGVCTWQILIGRCYLHKLHSGHLHHRLSVCSVLYWALYTLCREFPMRRMHTW